jgi:hypothetical protein
MTNFDRVRSDGEAQSTEHIRGRIDIDIDDGCEAPGDGTRS